MSAAKVLSALPNLDPKDLAQVQARVGILLSNSPTPAASAEDEALRTVHDQVVFVLRQWGELRSFPLQALLRSRNGSLLRTGSKSLVDFVNKFLKPKNRVERLRAIRILIGVCARWSNTHWHRTPTYKTVCLALVQIHCAVEDQFPGYLRSGLLPMIIKTRKSAAV